LNFFLCKDSNDIWLVKPGEYPPFIGQFEFNTLGTVSFDLPSAIPTMAQTFIVTVSITNGGMRVDTPVGLWLWTDCGGPPGPYVHFKRQTWYPQAAVGYDSETFSFVHCPNNRKIFVQTDRTKSGAANLNLYAVAYTF